MSLAVRITKLLRREHGHGPEQVLARREVDRLVRQHGLVLRLVKRPNVAQTTRLLPAYFGVDVLDDGDGDLYLLGSYAQVAGALTAHRFLQQEVHRHQRQETARLRLQALRLRAWGYALSEDQATWEIALFYGLGQRLPAPQAETKPYPAPLNSARARARGRIRRALTRTSARTRARGGAESRGKTYRAPRA